MSQFKPGDVVRAKPTFVVAEVKDTGLLRVEENVNGLLYAGPELVELVEPSVPVSKIREVFQDRMPHCKLGAQLMLRAMFHSLTGEPLQKEQ